MLATMRREMKQWRGSSNAAQILLCCRPEIGEVGSWLASIRQGPMSAAQGLSAIGFRGLIGGQHQSISLVCLVRLPPQAIVLGRGIQSAIQT